MNLDKLIKELVQEEVAAATAPLRAAIDQLGQQTGVMAQLASVFGGGHRKPGRPPKMLTLTQGPSRRNSRRTRGTNGVNDRPCALIGCKNDARSKGFCAAHYQKYKMLERTNRLPSDWRANAPPHSVKNITLPRGRAGSLALKEARTRN